MAFIRSLALIALAVVALARGSASAAPSTQSVPSVTVEDQAITEGMVTADQIVASQDGWVVVHTFGQDGNLMLTPVAGMTQIKAGTQSAVQVKLDKSFNAGQKLVLMLHVDAGTIGTYEFPDGPDVPVTASGRIVMSELTVLAGPQGGTDTGSTLPNTGSAGSTSEGGLALGVLAVLAGLTLTFGARRRT